MAGVKLKRLTIHKYPNVAPGTELTFNDTWNVLLGRNGTGKTTLLKLIAMVVRDDFSALKETAFSIEYEIGFPHAEVVVSLQNRPREPFASWRPKESLEELARRATVAAEWSYHVTLTAGAFRWSLSSGPSGTTYGMLTAEPIAPSPTALSPFDRRLLYLAILQSSTAFYGTSVAAWMLPTTFSGAYFLGRCGRFDEALTAFEILCGAVPAESGSGLPAAFAMSSSSDTPMILSGPPEALWSQRVTSYQPESLQETVHAESLRVPQVHAPFLQRAVELFGFDDAEMILHLVKKESEDPGMELRTYSNFSFLFTLPGGSQITQAALSYGQKRLLAFLYYVACNDEIIIADELVNGMHYDWIEACLKEIGERQSFLTSQNPLLLDFLPFASPEDVQKSFIQCTHAPRPEGHGRAQFAFHNLSAEDSATFFRAYEAGVQHVSEILKTKGMW
jgi:energy-coupling factor transporter ATP-binding protein EcfA2